MSEPARGLTVRTLQSMVWTGGGVTAELALQAVIVMVLARLLVPADFGIVTVALVVTGFVGIFGELGLSPALIQRERLTDAHVRTAFTVALVLALGIAAALSALAPWIARLLGIPAASPVIAVVAVSLVIHAWSSVPSALLQRAMRFRVLSIAAALSYVVGFGGVGIALAAAGHGAWALVAAHLTQVLVQAGILTAACRALPRPGLDRTALGELVAYGSRVSAARLANYVALRGDNLVVGHVLGPTALGLYGPAYHLMALPADLFQRIVQVVLFPAISRLQTDPARLASVYRRGLAVTALTALPGTVAAIALAPHVVGLLLGPAWNGVIGPLQILAVAMFFRVGYKMSVVVVKAAGTVHQLALRQIPYPLMVLTFAWIGTRWSIEGVAVGIVVALGVHYLLVTTLGLRVAGLTAREYVDAHRPAVALTGAIIVQGWVARAVAGAAEAPAWADLPILALSTTLTVAALVRWAPMRVLGAEGLWFSTALGRFVAGACARPRMTEA